MKAEALPQGDVRLLNTRVAQRLLYSRELARLAYVAQDNKPRVVPVMFHWTGKELVICSFNGALKNAAITRRPDIAITIDTARFPPEVLMLRGRAEIKEVEGIPPEFELANVRGGGAEFGAGRVAQVDHPGVSMYRIGLRPSWVGVIDFQTRFSGGRTADEFSRRGRS